MESGVSHEVEVGHSPEPETETTETETQSAVQTVQLTDFSHVIPVQSAEGAQQYIVFNAL